MTTPERVRVSFIGAGGICEQRHLPGLQQIPGVELVAVCNRSVESSRRIQQTWGFERIETDWRKVIDDPTVDALFIGTWPYLHRELSIAALAAGKQVFCQARMCLNWQEAELMTAAAALHPQQVHMICPSPFRVRWERTVKRILSSPGFGTLLAVNVCSLSNANGNPHQVSWREQVEYSGLNILQVGIFAETLNAWCGEMTLRSALTSIPLPEKFDSAGLRHEIQIPQTVALTGRLPNGGNVVEYHSGLSANIECSEITLHGSHQTCLVDFRAGNVSLFASETPIDRKVVESNGDPWQVELDFITAVRHARRGEPWQVSPDFFEASRYMRKLQAIHDLASTASSGSVG